MRLMSITIQDDSAQCEKKFKVGVNLIHSTKNTQGKTTLLRFILYALGYAIPSTKKLNFENCFTKLNLQSEFLGEVELTRSVNSRIVMRGPGDEESMFLMPDDMTALHSKLFGCESELILSNLLGAYYIDQEKGWTLLNRGKVIGSIHFSIEEFIAGLSRLDYEAYKRKLDALSKEITKVENLKTLSKYRDSLEANLSSVSKVRDTEEQYLVLKQLEAEIAFLKKEKSRVASILKENEFVQKFIREMRLRIRDSEGKEILVVPDNVIGLNFSVDLLHEKMKFLSTLIKSKESDLAKEKEQEGKSQDVQDFFPEINDIKTIDEQLMGISMDTDALESKLKDLRGEYRRCNKEIQYSICKDNDVFKYLSHCMLDYLNRLNVTKMKASDVPNYLLTNDLKILSGADFHKTVFAFRMAYIKTVQEFQGINLPIIIDSPGGTEITKENLKLMEQVLQSDFSDHQIIIASVEMFDDWEGVHRIEIEYPLLSTPILGREQSEGND